MKVYQERNKQKITSNFPRNYDKSFNKLFETYLNIPSCQVYQLNLNFLNSNNNITKLKQLPDLRKDWIDQFDVCFKSEFDQSFLKSTNYLKNLNNIQLLDFS